MHAERPGDNESLQDTRYGFDRLEQSVEFLLKEHERANIEREALLAELADREHRIQSLESKLATEGDRRTSAVESVDRILARLETIEAAAASASETSTEVGT